MQQLLRVENVSKAYGEHKVLQDINLTLTQSEIFGLIGLNGTGKTTLIKAILDLVRADSGRVYCMGKSTHEPDARRHIMYLPEKFHPSRYLKGSEYLELTLSYYGKVFDMACAEAMAKQLGLEPNALSMRIGSYSKGMAQKIGLLAAFMADVPLMLLDEPMSGLDPRSRIHLKHMLLEARQAGRSVFFSSHILSDVEEICNRIGVIHQGKILYIGSPAEFRQRYQQAGDDTLEKAFLYAVENESV
jgi:ABC-2 type transport system ATP-binding protein